MSVASWEHFSITAFVSEVYSEDDSRAIYTALFCGFDQLHVVTCIFLNKACCILSRTRIFSFKTVFSQILPPSTPVEAWGIFCHTGPQASVLGSAFLGALYKQ